MKILKPFLFTLILSFALGHAQLVQGYSATFFETTAVLSQSESLIRTELYFGRNKPNGSTVSDEEWEKFLSDVVTPRFPDGFTVVDGMGQFRGKDGVIVREASKLIVVLYSKKGRRLSNAKIEEIRAEYRKRFNQESVLRVDLSKDIDVSF